MISKEELDQLLESQAFCPFPWQEINLKNDGAYALCCVSNKLGYSIKTHSLLQHVHSQQMQEIRKATLEGNSAFLSGYCHHCYYREKMYGSSWRKINIQNIKKYLGLKTDLRKILSACEYDFQSIRTMDLRLYGNNCNLKCLTCNPINSSAIAEEARKYNELPELSALEASPWEALAEAQKESFFEDMRKIAPNLRKISIGGGEPFIMKHHLAFIKYLVAEKFSYRITLSYNTNATVLNEDILDLFSHFQKVILILSIDGGETLNNYIRSGSQFDVILNNINKLRKIRNVVLSVNTVVSLLNIARLSEEYDYIKKTIHPQNIELSILTDPAFLACFHLPEEMKKNVLAKLMNHGELNSKYAYVLEALRSPGSPEMFDTFVTYIKKTDSRRGTDIRKILPEYEAFFK
jgi:sulfatase maturation enzyme AslB (radical SAM superfamily)